MSSAEVLRRCHDRLVELEAVGLRIPDPFDAFELAERAGHCLGHRIRLFAVEMPVGAPSGLTFFTKDGGHIIVYEKRTNQVHREHIVSHELGHILLGHEPMLIEEPGVAAVLFPRLSPSLVSRALNRNGSYGRTDEVEAETMATILLERVSRTTGNLVIPGQTSEDEATAARISKLFEHPR